MDKEILKQYIDACEQVKEAKADILRLKKNRKKIVQDRVSGSAHEFPYTAKSFHIEGLSYPVVKDPDELDRREAILQERRSSAGWRHGCSQFRSGCSGSSGIASLRSCHGERWRLRWEDGRQRTA